MAKALIKTKYGELHAETPGGYYETKDMILDAIRYGEGIVLDIGSGQAAIIPPKTLSDSVFIISYEEAN